jgi:hypothetical protein
MIIKIKTYITLFSISIFIACSNQIVNKPNKNLAELKIVDETEILPIPLLGDIAKRNSEISSLCWHKDKLILLPQYPNDFGGESGKIFFIDQVTLLNFISGYSTNPILPDFYSIDLSNFEEFFTLGSGFEGIAINGDTVYFSIESMNDGKTETILLRGEIDLETKIIILDENSLTKDPTELFIHNISDESILYYNGNVIPIFEIHGKNINKSPQVSVFDNNLKFKKKIPFPTIEYRITDVTDVDNSGKFWAINYFFPGDDKKLNPAIDELARNFGIGESHLLYNPVERLVEFMILEDKIVLSDQVPIYLKLMSDNSRNWEGIARFEDGFLIATDTFPETIFAFVKPKNL